MTEGLVGLGLSNLLVSSGIGLLAYVVHRRGRYPALAHLLWVFALVKAVTPPLLSVPLEVLPAKPLVQGASESGQAALSAIPASASRDVSVLDEWLGSVLPSAVVVVWLAGSAIVLLLSLGRIRRFGRLLAQTSSAAPGAVQHLADAAAYELGMRAAPLVVISAAELSPMTWWAGGRVRIVLPRTLVAEVGDQQLRWILAHELAHVRRRDHLVRWLEWLASVVGWWNPVVWWARRSLRRDEEDACDALVIERMTGGRQAYARTLLAVTELLSRPGSGPPALATGIDAASSLEHRFVRIVRPGRTRAAPRALVIGCLGTAILFTLGGVDAAAAPIAEPNRSLRPPASTPGAQPPDIATASVTYRPVSGALQAPVAGGDGVRRGTSSADDIKGTEGDESIRGFGGADTLRGGRGADLIRGGAGDDAISGGDGPDIISGGAGDDDIRGGSGSDTIEAGSGDDLVRVWADAVPDSVDCGSGTDRAVIDSSDVTAGCEVVVIRDPS